MDFLYILSGNINRILLKSILISPKLYGSLSKKELRKLTNLRLPEPGPGPGQGREAGRLAAGSASLGPRTRPRLQQPRRTGPRRLLGIRGPPRTAGCTCPAGGCRSPRQPRPSAASCWAGPGRRGRLRRRTAAGCRDSPRSGRQQVA